MRDYLPLFGVLLGGLLTIAGGYISTVLIENRRQKREARNLALAFRGELSALRKIVAERQYIEGLKGAIDFIRKNNQPYHLIINVRREYFNVFSKNVDKIGALSPPLPEWIATFYTQANAVLEDFHTHRDGTYNQAPPQLLLHSYEELLRIFEDTMALAGRICAEIDNQYP